MVNKAMPYLGSIPTLTRLSLTCRSLFDPAFLTSLASCWPALECLRLARPLKDDNDMKAYILYRYDFPTYEQVVSRLVGCLGSLQQLAYIAIDLSFADYRLMRTTHIALAPGPVLPRHIVLPKSLQPPQPSIPVSPTAVDAEADGEGGSGSETDADGDTIMDDATIVGGPLANGMAALHVSAPADPQDDMADTTAMLLSLQTGFTTAVLATAESAQLPSMPLPSTASDPSFLAQALYPTTHNPNTSNPLECPFCLRGFRAHSYFIEHEVAMGLARGLSSLAAVRFRASFPNPGTGDAKENKWLIRRVSMDGMIVDSEQEQCAIQVWAPKWE